MRVRTPGKPGVLTRTLAGLAVCKDPGHAALNAPRGPYTQRVVRGARGPYTSDLASGSYRAVCPRTAPGGSLPPGSLHRFWAHHIALNAHHGVLTRNLAGLAVRKQL